MLVLKEIRGKKANTVRWDALKLLDWEEDAAVIQRIMEVKNPLFFSRRTPEEVVAEIREKVKWDKAFNAKEA